MTNKAGEVFGLGETPVEIKGGKNQGRLESFKLQIANAQDLYQESLQKAHLRAAPKIFIIRTEQLLSVST